MIEVKDLQQLISRNKELDAELNSALICASYFWGTKASELALIEVGDVLSNKGQLNKKWLLRSEIAFNKRARELYTEREDLIDYLDEYLKFRSKNNQGVSNLGEYRGLDSESKLFLNPKGEPFSFSKRSTNDGVNEQPIGMNSHFKKLFKNSGLQGVTYKDFRNSLAIQMYREGGYISGVIKDIMVYLGIRSYSAMNKVLSGDKKKLHEMIKGIHKRI